MITAAPNTRHGENVSRGKLNITAANVSTVTKASGRA